ncbi:grasp-with-spasm system ATP-grasp peptide maturase [Paraflavisolibacter sp. H34]|uniref:grasp-with-spasm system ATP-grasp peptide maturase n=1 Tax=Huijunlia imazamoxiresistens TaxID=3127457 RepID=UPI00301A392F
MICIFSSCLDQSTTDVLRWLHHLGVRDVIRVNYNEPGEGAPYPIDLSEGSFSFLYDGRRIHLHQLEAVWYRKGMNWLCDSFYPVTVPHFSKFTAYLHHKLQAEEAKLAEYLHFVIEQSVPALGSAAKCDLNKLLVLAAAREAGLLVPAFYVTNHKEGISQLLAQSPALITKALSDGLYLFDAAESARGFFSYTEKVEPHLLEQLPDRLSPSLLQQQVPKKYEVRVFFLEDRCYAMAILSQGDEQTKTDYRKYNEKRPNRFVPYRLPDSVEQKLRRLFRSLGLNTGSADLIVDPDDRYYFLEINPVGQFGMVSAPCNYFLEKKVAQKLMLYAQHSRTNAIAPDYRHEAAPGVPHDSPR